MTPTLTLRTVTTEAELHQALAIRREVFVLEQGVPEDEERDDLDPCAHHFLASRGEDPIGTARLVLPPGTDQGKIGRVAVLRGHRGLGAGAALVGAAEGAARALGLSRLVLDAQVQVLGFYERLGYTPIGPLFLDAGILHRRMERELKGPAGSR